MTGDIKPSPLRIKVVIHRKSIIPAEADGHKYQRPQSQYRQHTAVHPINNPTGMPTEASEKTPGEQL